MLLVFISLFPRLSFSMASRSTVNDSSVVDRDNLCVSVEEPRALPEYATDSESHRETTAEATLRHSLVRDLLPSGDAGHNLREPPSADSLEPDAFEAKRRRKVN